MKRILIVDDEENIGRSLRLILEREGYSVSTCGQIAEARAFSNRVDAYLLDVRLPDGNGIDLLRHLRQTGQPGAGGDDLGPRRPSPMPWRRPAPARSTSSKSPWRGTAYCWP